MRAVADTHGSAGAMPLSSEVRPQLVLQALVEKFGGEVTAAALARHLSLQPGWTPPASDLVLRDVLQALYRLGAVDLEANDGNDFIVRLMPDGARPGS